MIFMWSGLKLHAEYGAVKNMPSEQMHEKGKSGAEGKTDQATNSNILALPGLLNVLFPAPMTLELFCLNNYLSIFISF